MKVLQYKIDKILNSKALSRYKLSQLTGIAEATLCQMTKGKSQFSDNIIKKVLPFLEVSRTEFESWILADKYSKEVLKLAVQAKKDFACNKQLILTTKIDSILHEKGISRTVLSKEIKYGQSGLNQIITGKRTMPKSVLERLSIAFEVSQDQILSWIIAGKYSLQILEAAYNLSNEFQ